LVNPDDWTEEIALELAKEVGINPLNETHWKVIKFMREDFKEKGQIPTIRRIKNAGGVPTKEVYDAFPDGPAKKAALISGLGKPQGCV
jgi:tRNA 2-thiouridine synthesizing protein E